MHHEKFRLDQIQNDRLLAITHFHMADIWLEDYYRMKCEISAQDASWKILTRSNSKWPRSVIIYFHMPNILQTVLDASPLL